MKLIYAATEKNASGPAERAQCFQVCQTELEPSGKAVFDSNICIIDCIIFYSFAVIHTGLPNGA